MEEFSYKNTMQVPSVKKIILSRGVGAAVADKKLVDQAVDELTLIIRAESCANSFKKRCGFFQVKKRYAHRR